MKNHDLFYSLLGKGFFPRELPVCFNTSSLTNMDLEGSVFLSNNKYTSKCSRFNLARRGSLRRAMSIPNPVNYFFLAKEIADNWDNFSKIYESSDHAISKPAVSEKGRALKWEGGFSLLPEKKLKTRRLSKYILKADISNFYSSIYSHSIPWSLHTKEIAKKDRSQNLLGNRIDKLVRNCQDQQTVGLPIGPDTSFAIAELIVSKIDNMMNEKMSTDNQLKYHRYIDDYEFGCASYAQAEETIEQLQENLSYFELNLNPKKTIILELPELIDPLWVYDLKDFEIKSNGSHQRKSILKYFDMTVSCLKNNPEDAVVQYAVQKTLGTEIDECNFEIYQNMLLQWAVFEPGILYDVINIIKFYHEERKFKVNINNLKEAFQDFISNHCYKGHTSEVCYALYGMIIFNIKIDDCIINKLKYIQNSFIALMVLDAKNKNLVSHGIVFDVWQELMNEEELSGENWLLAYEANIKNWLEHDENYVDKNDYFKFFKKNNISFYNDGSDNFRESSVITKLSISRSAEYKV